MGRKQSWREFTAVTLTVLASCAALLWLAGCTRRSPSDQQIRQQAAQTTEQVRTGAKKAAAEARVAAANARREATDIAAGVREGMHSHGKQSPSATGSGGVDINSASEAHLMTLPGISASRARSIIHNRPYDTPHDLLRKGVLTQAEYNRISSEIVTRP